MISPPSPPPPSPPPSSSPPSPSPSCHHLTSGFYASITGSGTWTLPNGDSFDIIGDGSGDNFLTVKISSNGPPESYLVSRDTYTGPRNDAGAKHGDGELVMTGGAVYKGSFENGKKHGKATVTYPNGDIFTGTYNQGERVGGGSLVLNNGDIYVGEWARDEDWDWKPHGRGTFQKASGAKSKPCVCVATRGKSIQFKSFSMTAMCSGCLVM